MGKYNIISKDLIGNQSNKVCEVVYQVEGQGYKEFKTNLVCLNIKGEIVYAFLEGQEGDFTGSNNDKTEFLDEFYLFQKGGSYRKTHPIMKSEKQILLDKKNKLNNDIDDIDREIRKVENKMRSEKYITYNDDIDRESLNLFLSNIKNCFNGNDRYKLQLVAHVFDGIKLMVYDKEIHKPVSMGLLDKGNNIYFRDLEDYEIPMD